VIDPPAIDKREHGASMEKGLPLQFENDVYDVTGSIVLYQNSLAEVREAVRSFLSTQLKVKLYLIDNSPNDGLRNLCSDPRVTYIFNGRNLGFGTAHNIAIKASVNEAAYHVVLNPDVYYDAGVLEELLEFGRSRPDTGVLMPKILNPDGTIQYLCKKLPTPWDLILRRFLPGALKLLAEERLSRYELRDRDYTKMMSVPVLSGCFMMLNCAALSKVGVFDERFFMYLEDVDLCRRIGQRFETIYFPDVMVYHRHGKGSYRNARLLMHHVLSAVRYFGKWGWYSDAEREVILPRATAPVVLHSKVVSNEEEHVL
jgi:hypothetical protein